MFITGACVFSPAEALAKAGMASGKKRVADGERQLRQYDKFALFHFKFNAVEFEHFYYCGEIFF